MKSWALFISSASIYLPALVYLLNIGPIANSIVELLEKDSRYTLTTSVSVGISIPQCAIEHLVTTLGVYSLSDATLPMRL
jgi:hypothetical protein